MSHKLHSLRQIGCWTSRSAKVLHTHPHRCSRQNRPVEHYSTDQPGSDALECSTAVWVAKVLGLPAWVSPESQVDQSQGLLHSWKMMRQCTGTVRLGPEAENMIQTILR
jgi:hypothetical protein